MTTPFERYQKTGLQHGTKPGLNEVLAELDKPSFREELTHLLNRHSKENGSGTPDFILADFLIKYLENFDALMSSRAQWRGESVELPALQQLRDKKRTVPAVIYLDDQRIEVGQAEVRIEDDRVLWGLIAEVGLVVEEDRTVHDLFRKQADMLKDMSAEDEAAADGVDTPPSGETEDSDA
jgi:hypothetical protein